MHHLDHRAGLVQFGQRRPFLGGQFSDMSQGHDALRKHSFAGLIEMACARMYCPAVAQYIMFNDLLHWGNSFLPLIVPTFFANPFDIFLMAASVIFTLPIVIAFFFAQKQFIEGIKLTGIKE